ncbi:ribonuclease H-like domain-containing protein, partial [Tanacetum coccineum]
LFLSQKKYVVEILDRAHMVNCNPSRTPIDTESKLGSDGDPVYDPTLYRSLAGSLQYLTFTRPDISYVVQQLFSSSTTDLVAYSDVDWAGCPNTRHSTSEAEYRGVANDVAETCWLRNLLRELHTSLSSATLVYCDNVRVLHVPSRYQYVDIFTKGFPSALFEEFRSSLSVRCSPAPTAEECSRKDVSYLTNLPRASERLNIFDADLSRPETFEAPIKGCIGVFHVAHLIDFEGKEPEEVQTERMIKASLGETDKYEMLIKTDYVHVDDVDRAHIHLLEYPSAKGRYICSRTGATFEELHNLLSLRYPEYKMPNIDFLKDSETIKFPGVSSTKLLSTGFEFKYGFEKMFDNAIDCCKRKNIL